MGYPETFEEFIHTYEFNDVEKIYTDGVELIPSSMVLEAWKYYTRDLRDITFNINELRRYLANIADGLDDIEANIDYVTNGD